MVYLIHFDQLSMLIKSAENPSHFYHLSSFSIRACSACLTQIARLEACYNSHTDSDIHVWHATKNKGSNVLNLPKQSQVCPSLILSFQFKMRISVIYGPLNVSWKRVVSVLSPLALNSCARSHIGTQKSHWDKTNKVNYHLKLCVPFVGLDHSATLRPNMPVLYHVNGNLQRAYCTGAYCYLYAIRKMSNTRQK